MKRDGFEATFDASPTIKDKILWIPIEALASLLNCTVEKNLADKRLAISLPKDAASPQQVATIRLNRMTSTFNNMSYPRPPIATFKDILIPGTHGLMSARLYDPNPADISLKALYVNIHGGGYTLGSIASSDHVCRDIANRSGQKVLSIEYGMMPEYPFPTGWEDAYAEVKWAYDNALKLGVDPSRIFVGGDSSGGNIANSVAMMARDRKKFSVAGLILAYPVIDMTAAWAAFVFKNTKDAQIPYASPMLGELSGMPPTLVLISETDGLRPEAEKYAALLSSAGNKVSATVVPGTKHGFLAVNPEAREMIARFIRQTR
jgi:acetyl esterase